MIVHIGGFLSTLSLRRATHYDNYNLHCVEISIHALLAESDLLMLSMGAILILFLSTLSLRRATSKKYPVILGRVISIHALLAESDPRNSTRHPGAGHFYPRSPCGERQIRTKKQAKKLTFLSTLSLRRATNWLRTAGVEDDISIHALLAESDHGS